MPDKDFRSGNNTGRIQIGKEGSNTFLQDLEVVDKYLKAYVG